jgi:indole-3-glycerol phosphate synthase
VLTQILEHKRLEIARLDERALRAQAAEASAPRPFLPREVAAGQVRLIAEIKRASPSKGLLAPHLDIHQIARIYADNGAAALSVLTDEKFFLGHLDYLRALRASAGPLPPLLRKDFILAPAQVYETRAAGADAMLLIAAALDDSALRDLHALALEQGLTPLVEVHTRAELDRVLPLPGLRLVGINNRDLGTFKVSLATTEALRPAIPPGLTVVSESGIFTGADVARLAALPVDAVLVGEALVTAPDIAAKVRELSGELQGEHLPLRHQDTKV